MAGVGKGLGWGLFVVQSGDGFSPKGFKTLAEPLMPRHACPMEPVTERLRNFLQYVAVKLLDAAAEREGVQVSLQIHSHEEEAALLARNEGP